MRRGANFVATVTIIGVTNSGKGPYYSDLTDQAQLERVRASSSVLDRAEHRTG
jgi:hypothetical protein